MREDVEFNADGVTLRGWFYTPDGASGSVPTIVMAGGHFDAYVDGFDVAGPAAVPWFSDHLLDRAGVPA